MAVRSFDCETKDDTAADLLGRGMEGNVGEGATTRDPVVGTGRTKTRSRMENHWKTTDDTA